MTYSADAYTGPNDDRNCIICTNKSVLVRDIGVASTAKYVLMHIRAQVCTYAHTCTRVRKTAVSLWLCWARRSDASGRFSWLSFDTCLRMENKVKKFGPKALTLPCRLRNSWLFMRTLLFVFWTPKKGLCLGSTESFLIWWHHGFWCHQIILVVVSVRCRIDNPFYHHILGYEIQ